MTTKQCLQPCKILACCLLLLATMQPCHAQGPASDSLLKTSWLYQKGKKNVSTGGLLLGIGVAGCLVGLAMGEEEHSTGWYFGPSNREFIFFLSGIVGTIGLFKLVQGGIRIQNARAELGTVMYQTAPGQQARMPAITMRWSLADLRNTKTVSAPLVR